MEKVSKWIQNFLIGKREEKDKKKVSSLLFAAEETTNAILPSSTPNKEKRRWSFKKSSESKYKIRHKNRSFDDIYTAQLVKQALQEQDIEQIREKAALPSNSNETNNNRSDDLIPTPYLEVKIRQRKETAAAAIKIQSVFRSYLSRRALRALRALVKLQALVRGHLVRKQTNAVLRCMQALMTIQVRARFKRVHTAQHPMKRTVLLQEEKVQPLSTKINNINQESRRSTSKKGGEPIDDHNQHYPQVQQISRFGIVHSRCHSILSKPENYHQICSNSTPCPSTDDLSSETTTNHDQQIQIEEIMRQNEPHRSSSNTCASKTKPTKFQHPSSFPQTTMSIGSPLLAPSYMSDTESSKAKTRSQSEPKRRPKTKKGSTKVESRPSTSTEGLNWVSNGPVISALSRQRPDEQQNQYPWLFKLYRSAKPMKKECDIDSASVTTYNSNYSTPFSPCEQPPVNLY